MLLFVRCFCVFYVLNNIQVGEVDESGQRLIEVSQQSLQVGLDQCRPGKQFSGNVLLIKVMSLFYPNGIASSGLWIGGGCLWENTCEGRLRIKSASHSIQL